MGKSHTELFDYFNELDIEYTNFEHNPVFTVEEAMAVSHDFPGMHVRNLFLYDKKKRFFLATLEHDKESVDLKALRKEVGANSTFSFGKPDKLMDIVGVTPGSVTPFGLINDTEKQLTFILDKDIAEAEEINAHPLRNDMSTTVKVADLFKFIKSLGYEVIIYDFENNHVVSN